MKSLKIITLLLTSFVNVNCFQPSAFRSNGVFHNNNKRNAPTQLFSQMGGDPGLAELDNFLATYFQGFYSIIAGNDELWKALREGDQPAGFTVFAVNDDALASLDKKKQTQLQDNRNEETTEKIGMYHIVNEAVGADELFASGGIITAGGEVPIGRSVTGGFMGIGGKEDGGVTLNGARVLNSYRVADGVVHEVDALINPNILWRYMDQLRIPGSS